MHKHRGNRSENDALSSYLSIARSGSTSKVLSSLSFCLLHQSKAFVFGIMRFVNPEIRGVSSNEDAGTRPACRPIGAIRWLVYVCTKRRRWWKGWLYEMR